MSESSKKAKALLLSATDGPWTYGGPLGFGHWIVSENAQVAVAYGGASNSKGAANAALIAAAPDLLAALAQEVEALERLLAERGAGAGGGVMKRELFYEMSSLGRVRFSPDPAGGHDTGLDADKPRRFPYSGEFKGRKLYLSRRPWALRIDCGSYWATVRRKPNESELVAFWRGIETTLNEDGSVKRKVDAPC